MGAIQIKQILNNINTFGFYMMILLIIIINTLLIYVILRNDKVIKFELLLVSLCHDYNMRHIEKIIEDPSNNAFLWCYDTLPPYKRKVFSFKKLTLKSYLSPNQLNRLLN